jgi:Arylsulfotransferase (ASST)
MSQPTSPNPSQTEQRRWQRSLVGVVATFVSALAASSVGGPSALADTTSPPPLTVLSSTPGFGHGEDLFITPTGDTSTYAQGPEILSAQGQPIWFHAVPQGLDATDFRVQTYFGQPVLTWWQGTSSNGVGNGTDYIYNNHYQQIATVQAGNGLQADAHEFYITPWNTAYITAYQPGTADLSSIGGPSDQAVLNGVVQEIDIATGQVLWQWNSAEHVPYSSSEQPLPSSPSTPWDWFHINAIHLNTNGDLLVDARNTWAAYDVDPASGNVNWTLGGKDSSFTEQAAPGQTLDAAGEIFAWQHDPEPVGNDDYTFFDDDATIGAPELPYSRAVTIHLDQWTKVATLISSEDQPEGQSATSQGNAQSTDTGNLLVGWGSLPYISAFSPFGRLVFNAQFPAGVNTYRAYLERWNPPGQGNPGGPGNPGTPWHHGSPGGGGWGFGGSAPWQLGG